MSLVKFEYISNPSTYYIPHLCILGSENLTTSPLRVVFDAATRDLNSVSLNDTLFTGPKPQKELLYQTAVDCIYTDLPPNHINHTLQVSKDSMAFHF